MILNFDNNPKFLEAGLSQLDSKEFVINITLDSHNKIYRVKYFCADQFIPYFEYISEYILDKNLDDLQVSLAHDIYSLVDKNQYLFDAYLLDWSLHQIKESLNLSRGDLKETNVSPDTILCRCNGIDLKTLEKDFLAYKGSTKEYIKASNAGMICGNCKKDLSSEFENLSKRNLFFDGKTHEELIEEIHLALTSFKEYSAQELDRISISKIELDYPNVVFNISLLEENFDTELLKVNLTNYLCSKLEMALEVKLTILQ